jgi:uncharacterized SAM-binding protein YcdF (DUF218 family)
MAMPLLFDKLLTQLAMPLGAAAVLLLLALLAGLLGRRRIGAGLLGCGLAWLLLWSTPVISDAVRLGLERQYPMVPAEALPEAAVIVVLGGGLDPGPPTSLYPNLNSAADRYWHAARLYHAGRAPRVLISGGRMPWMPGVRGEAEMVGVFLRDLGVPAEAIVLESRSASTRENALYSAAWLAEHAPDGAVLLVTSALHMPRALATFERAGIKATPAATDFEIMPRSASRTPLDVLPSAAALEASSRAIKEWLGLWVYRWRGWA